MASLRTKYLLWLTALALVMACAPTFAAQPIPTTDPNSIGTIIVKTANAASTQTVAAMPTPTPTETYTPTLRSTNTPEPTATATVLFLFFTYTPVVFTKAGDIIGTASPKDYACQLLSSSPENGTIFGTRQDFDGKWTVKNIGRKDWDGANVDYVYVSGDKIHKVEGYDLVKTVKRGDIRELIVDMIAPKTPGTYHTTWGMVAGKEHFCEWKLTIRVQ